MPTLILLRRLGMLLLALGLLVGTSACGDDETDDPQQLVGEGGAGAGGEQLGGSAPGGGGMGGSAIPAPAALVVPSTLAIPYVDAGAGGSSGTFEVSNQGDLLAEGPSGAALQWSLSGDPAISLVQAPERLQAQETGTIVLAYAGAQSETIASATLSVQVGSLTLEASVFAVAGEASLEAGAWQSVSLPGGEPCGQGLTIGLPTAPFPHASAGFTDDTVRIFVPEGLRDLGGQDLVVHFHGHGTDVAETLMGHRYEEHFCASGVNGILVVPQGPVQTSSGNFGKLMVQGGLEALVHQVLVVLYREGSILSPALGELVLTAHSGGYVAVSKNLDPAINGLGVTQAHLFDAIYALEPSFIAFAEAGGLLRSNYTPFGGTVDNNQVVLQGLQQAGVSVVTEASQRALRDAPVVIYPADSTHSGATRVDAAYADQLRFALAHHRRGPRIELREAVVTGGMAEVRWLSPYEAQLLGFRVLTSTDGATWTIAAEVAADQESATFSFAGAARVRVVPRMSGMTDEQVLGSDILRMAAQPEVLIVDGFDRVIDGSHGGLRHDFAAIVGEAVGAVASISNEAITEDAFDLTPYPAAVWLLGDESSADHVLSAAEQQALSDYLTAGGAIVMSGSEVAYDLDGSSQGAALLANVFGASYAADDSGSYSVTGLGALSALGTMSYAGAGAPYPEDYPDVLATTGGGALLLSYGTGGGAAVGLVSQGALVGFPLELIDETSARAAALGALLDFVAPP